MSAITVTSKDRFSFTLFLAAALHACVILGVGFSSDFNNADSPSIEVTLSVANDVVEPEEADFIAATNQIGSGEADEVMEMTTTEQADFQSNQFQAVMSQPMPVPESNERREELLSSELAAEDQVNRDQQELAELLDVPPVTQFDRQKWVEEIASLEARIANDRQALAKLPRTKRLNSVSTKSAAEASYLNAWRQKCERIGRANYPPGKLEGEVLMLVSILSDGTLEEVKILRSSGYRALDQAALATVRQASPYQPFGVEMRKSYDRLEFTRTWQFTKQGSGLGG